MNALFRPEVSLQEFRTALEERIEAHANALERLIAALDAIDGDPDLESNGDLEPSLGGGMDFIPGYGWRLSSDDREGSDASDMGEPACDPQTLNPRPIRAKRITRKVA